MLHSPPHTPRGIPRVVSGCGRILVLLFCSALVAIPLPIAATRTAADLIDEYLRLSTEDEEPYGQARAARLRVLRLTWCCADEAVPAIAAVLPEVTSAVQRRELLETLGRLPTRESSRLLVGGLDDPDPQVRAAAVAGLRRLAWRIERRGVVDVPLEAQFEPAIDGLVPHLLRAADDRDADVRRNALWALADTREPEAAAEIRRHLEDPDDALRLLAACLLTEFGDDAGLEVLGAALQRAAGGESETEATPFRVQHLLASLARVTQDNPGPPPMDPMLASSMARAAELQAELDDLLVAWVVWWDTHGTDGRPRK